MEKILEKWDTAREKMGILEEKIKKYKEEVEQEMNRRGATKLSIGKYTVTKRKSTRGYLSKETVPSDIWQKYSTRCSYDAFFLTKGK